MEFGDKMESQGIVTSTWAQISGLYSQVSETLLLWRHKKYNRHYAIRKARIQEAIDSSP